MRIKGLTDFGTKRRKFLFPGKKKKEKKAEAGSKDYKNILYFLVFFLVITRRLSGERKEGSA